MAFNSCSCFSRNFYHQLSKSGRKRGVLARMRVSLKKIGYCIGKQWGPDRILRRATRRIRLGRTRQMRKSYDAYSYSQNFDDGLWREEDEEFYRNHSFSFRFVGLPISNLAL